MKIRQEQLNPVPRGHWENHVRYLPIGGEGYLAESIFTNVRQRGLLSDVRAAVDNKRIRAWVTGFELIHPPNLPEKIWELSKLIDLDHFLHNLPTATEVWANVLKFELRSKNRVAHSVLKYSAYWNHASSFETSGEFEGTYPDGLRGTSRRADILAGFQSAVVECGDTPLERFHSWVHGDLGVEFYPLNFVVYPYPYMKLGKCFWFGKNW